MKTLGKMSCEIGLYSTYVLLKCEVSFHLATSATITYLPMYFTLEKLEFKRRPSRLGTESLQRSLQR